MDCGYTYGNLDSDRRETRLLRLHPGNWEDLLDCSLQVVSLDEQPDYEALSYTWGDAGDTKTLQIDGTPFEVPANLCAALRRLRNLHHARVLWADAACINQEDLEERSLQVALMGEVFSRASGVFVWLGESVSGVDASSLQSSPGTLEHGKDMKWIRENLERVFEHSAFPGPQSETLAALGILYVLSIDCHWTDKPLFAADGEGQYQVSDKYTKAWQAAMKLLHLPWWSRMWVVQELVLAQKAVLVIGSVSAPWELISGFYHSYSKHLPPGACCHSSVTWKMVPELWDDIVLMRLTFSTLNTIRTELGQQRDKPAHAAMWDFLWLLRHKQATDPRDKVYGVLGLLPRQSPPFLLPSYSITTAEVFSRCMRALIEADDSLIALVGPRLNHPGLPTWAIDLLPKEHAESVLFSHNISRRISSSTLFSACGNQGLRFLLTSSKLKLCGIPVDVVNNAAAAWKKDSVTQTLREWEILCNAIDDGQALSYPSGCTRYDAFWRTMLRDTMRDYDNGVKTRRANATDETSYKYFRSWLSEPSDANNKHAMAFRKSFFIATQDQQLFTTRDGYIGLSDRPLLGDEIWILFGGSVPFMLRRYPDDSEHTGCYALVGDCYVHGIMDGEAMEAWEEKVTKEVTLA